MPLFPQNNFPTLDQIMQRARSIVNDTYPGVNGQQGRVLTNDAPFTIPYLNNAFDTLQRKLRNEGVTFPIQDNYLLLNVTPVRQQSASVQVSITFNGYFDGTVMHASPRLPSDLMQPYEVWEQDAGSGQNFRPMEQPEGGLPSVMQGSWLGIWEWRNYGIYMVGSTQTKNLRLKYKSVQLPLDVPAADFATTKVNILDSATALAYMVAVQYAEARGAASIESLEAKVEDAIGDMALEYVRRSQSVVYRRPSYQGGGSNGGNGMLGQTGEGQ